MLVIAQTTYTKLTLHSMKYFHTYDQRKMAVHKYDCAGFGLLMRNTH